MTEDISFFVPEPGEKMFIAGQNGSGKTYFIERVAAEPDRYSVILDAKLEFDYSRFRDCMIATTPEQVVSLGKQQIKTIVYQPTEKLLSDPDSWEAVLSYVYRRKNTQLIIDEFFSLADPERPTRYPESLRTILTRGRSRGITVYMVTQRPSGIPLLAMSEAQHYVEFRLNLPQDRKRMEEVTGNELFRIGVQNLTLNTPKTGFEFLYYRQKDDLIGVYCLNKS